MKKKLLLLALFMVLLPLPARAVEEAPIRVAIIDTGISTNIIPKENVAKGANYVRLGYETEDSLGHGTTVAQLILKNAPKAELVPLTYCDEVYREIQKVDLDTIAQMIKDAVDVYNCNIINISAATKTDYEPLKEAVEYAENQGVVVVAAAGNEATDVPSFPASYSTVIGVGALNKKGEIADFNPSIGADVYALGEKLPATLPNGEKVLVTGTSFACGEITAMAVILLEKNSQYSPKAIRDSIRLQTNNWSFDEYISPEIINSSILIHLAYIMGQLSPIA